MRNTFALVASVLMFSAIGAWAQAPATVVAPTTSSQVTGSTVQGTSQPMPAQPPKEEKLPPKEEKK
ncbi:hypothetical protein [Magnetospirillum sp. 15-1]|uniref:hypothetical protein n=1 Tax=Magnetospirillum sp. 15-1 TaxID=1979370 RepID=UPI000BBC607A|nr:hypothetical protein [Magnetospirillum sp. 15-1]